MLSMVSKGVIPVHRLTSRARVSMWYGISMFLAAALPFLLAFPVLYIESQHRARDELAVANVVVIRQAESIVRQAVDMAGRMTELAGQPCDQVRQVLQQAGTLRPYFRSIALIDNNVLYCSSATGAFHLPLATLTPQTPNLPAGRSMFMAPGTPLVPGRPALLLFLGIAAGRGVLASVDGQYLLDLIDSADQEGRYVVSLKIGDGHVLSAADVRGRIPRTHAGVDSGGLSSMQASRLYPIEVTAAVDARRLGIYQRALWLQYLPFLLLAAALAVYLTHRVHARRASMAVEIRKGMRHDEFRVQYQPIVDLGSGACVGVEALLRWRHPLYGQVRPDLFIPVAEENGLAVPLTRHLLGLIERDLRAAALPRDFHLGVNVMAEHLSRLDLIADIERFLHNLKAVAPKLTLEITERKSLPDTAAVLRNMQALRAIGVAFAIDDFGTGHSSLAYLEKFTVDYLKIDRGFVSIIDTDAVNAPVLELIIALGTRLGVGLIAEGIETEAQAAYLRAKGVKLAQGFLFAHPMDVAALQAWLAGHHGAGRGGWAAQAAP